VSTTLELTRSKSHLEAIAGAGLMPACLAAGTGNGLLPELGHESTHVGTGWVVDAPLDLSNLVPPLVVVPPDQPAQSNATMLESLHSLSGLTWEQIARLFNVSRRSVHLWLAGGRLSAANEERLVDLEAMLSNWPGTPEERRHRLFQAQDSGLSLFDEARGSKASRSDDINRPLEPLPESA
jgi:hypothetical protein